VHFVEKTNFFIYTRMLFLIFVYDAYLKKELIIKRHAFQVLKEIVAFLVSVRNIYRTHPSLQPAVCNFFTHFLKVKNVFSENYMVQ
jgi:hypothetical protein